MTRHSQESQDTSNYVDDMFKHVNYNASTNSKPANPTLTLSLAGSARRCVRAAKAAEKQRHGRRNAANGDLIKRLSIQVILI